MTARPHLGLGLAVALVMAGCGVAQKSAPPASAPGGGAQEAPESLGSDSETQKKPEAEAEPGQPAFGGQFAQPPASSLDDAESLLERDFKDVARALGTTKDCDTAKKALDSMKRSASRICDLNGPSDPGARCAKARDRVDAAGENIRRGCGP